MTKEADALPAWLALLIRHPLVIGTLGWLVSAACVYLFFFVALPEYRKFPDRPIEMSAARALAAADADQEVWVELSDVRWDCADLLQDGKVVVLRAPGSGRRFLAELDSGKDCSAQGGMPTGVLRRARPRRLKWLIEHAGLALPKGDEPILLLCTYCGGNNARIGLVLSPLLVLLGLAAYPCCRVLRRRYYGY